MMKRNILLTTFLFFLNFGSVLSHAFLQFPPARKSKYSEYYLDNTLVDYNIMAPLNSGYSFPCKGFPKGPSTTTINGNTINVMIESSATHGGGHCQFGITTNDNDFVVLSTVMNNCLTGGMSYSINLPSDFPESEITVFWTWVNAIGNREYYMDCADITIKNGNTNLQSTVSGLELLVLNLPGYTTVPEFPNPGMYDGSDLFESRNQKSITVSAFINSNSTSTSVSSVSTTSTTSTTSTPEPTQTTSVSSVSTTSTPESTQTTTVSNVSITSTPEPTQTTTVSSSTTQETEPIQETQTTISSHKLKSTKTKTLNTTSTLKTKQRKKTNHIKPKSTPKIENKILYKSQNLTIVKLNDKDCEDNE